MLRFTKNKTALVNIKYLLKLHGADVKQIAKWHTESKQKPSEFFEGRYCVAHINKDLLEALGYGRYFSDDLKNLSGLGLDTSALLFLLSKDVQTLDAVLLARMQYVEIFNLIKSRNEMLLNIKEAVSSVWSQGELDHIMKKNEDVFPALTKQLLKIIGQAEEDISTAQEKVEAKLDSKYKNIIYYCRFW